MKQAVERAIKEQFRKNKPHFADPGWPEDGRLDYYGFEVTGISDDGSNLELNWIFKTTEKYCCIEPGCHTNTKKAKWWKQLRSHLKNEGINPPTLIINVTVIIEPNVRLSLPTSPEEKKGYQYKVCWTENYEL